METILRRCRSQNRKLFYWNSLIQSSTQDGFFAESLQLYSQMLRDGVHGDNFTFPHVAKACAKLGSLLDGTKVHAHSVLTGFNDDVYVQTALLDMYGKCSELHAARCLFDEMRVKSLVSWNSMICAYCSASEVEEAFRMLKQLWGDGICPNSSTFVSVVSVVRWLSQGLAVHGCVIKFGFESDVLLSNSLMTMYVKFDLVDSARIVFDVMKEKSNVSWTIIVGGYAKLGDFSEAFELFSRMRQLETSLDYLSFVNLFQVNEMLVGSSLHALAVKYGCDNKDLIANSLVSMYAKCSDLSPARKVFDFMHAKDVVAWTSMIAGYVHNGYPSEALSLFENLLATNVKPNEVTISTVLLACADASSLVMGEMIEEYVRIHGFDLDLQVQTSLIHMYCKCGSIVRAKDVFDRISNKDVAVWTSMIIGYAIHGSGNEALKLFENMLTEGVKPDAIVFTGVLLACSHAGLVEDGLKIFNAMRKDFRVEPGIEHFSCLVDLHSRSGHLDLALKAIYDMPKEAQMKVLGPFLSACRTQGNIQVGESVAGLLSGLETQETMSYVLMANIYASFGRWKDAASMRRTMDSRRLVKMPGRSRIEIDSPG